MKKFYGVIAAVSAIIAAVLASSACFLFTFQPEEPESLSD
jgi:cyclic lactone autoinducer peptide